MLKIFSFICFCVVVRIVKETTGLSLADIQMKQYCESWFEGDAFYDEDDGKNICTLKLNAKNRYSSELMNNGTLHCPIGTSYWASGSDETDMTGGCSCPGNLVPNPERKACITGKLLNQNCNNTNGVVCNAYAGLKCSKTGVCVCNLGAEWNHADSLCYSDEDCSERRYGAYHDKNSKKCLIPLMGEASCNIGKPYHTVYPNEPSCPPNSVCISSHYSSGYGPICKCSNGYGSDAMRRKCLPVKNYKEVCTLTSGNLLSKNDPCDSDNGLECTNGKCDCKGSASWEKRLNACRVPEGSICASSYSSPVHEQCGKNSDCSLIKDTVTRYGSFDYDYRCKCSTGFTKRDGFCYANYLGKCNVNGDCYEGMTCIDRSCRCTQPLSQKVTSDGDSCKNLVGSPCNEHSKLPPLTVCLNDTTTCAPGLLPSITGDCMLPYGRACGSNDEYGSLKCSFETGLACIEETCRCLDPILNYVDDVGCVGPVGTMCGDVFPVGPCRSGECAQEKYRVKCAAPAICKLLTGVTSKCILPVD